MTFDPDFHDWYEDEDDGPRGYRVGLVEVVHETNKAILVRLLEDDDEEVWIPKSQIHHDSEVSSTDDLSGTLVVTEWLAEEKGWE